MEREKTIMGSILYVISNINLETVDLVASCLKKRYPDGFERIVFFESKEAEENEYREIQIYRKFFSDFEKSVVLLNGDGSIPTDKMYSVLNTEGNKIVDLSNGQKITTSSLYLASTLCRITDIYCLILRGKPTADMIEGIGYEYIKLEQMRGIEKLAKLSYFDLVYYTEDVNTIITDADRKRSAVLNSIYNGMISGITGFFTGTFDARTIINNLTIGNESLVEFFLHFLQNHEEARRFAIQNETNLYKVADPIGILSRFCKKYVRSEANPDLISLCTVPGLLSGLRDYRNISAHYSKNHVVLTADNARTVINMELEVLKCFRNSASIWRVM